MATQRKYPRITVTKEARVALRRTNSSPAECTLLDVSAEGVALRLSPINVAPEQGDSLTLSVNTGSGWIDIPGRVSYALTTASDGVVVGIKLHLEVSGSATRQAWSRWLSRLVSTVRPTFHINTAAQPA